MLSPNRGVSEMVLAVWAGSCLRINPDLAFCIPWRVAIAVFKGKAISETSLDGVVQAELPPKAPEDEVYKVIPLWCLFMRLWSPLGKGFLGAKWF